MSDNQEYEPGTGQKFFKTNVEMILFGILVALVVGGLAWLGTHQ